MKFEFKKEYPFTGTPLDLDGLSYHYLDEGAGDPVVMVHGNPSWSFYYRNLVLALRDRYRCIVPDHIGCGFSDKPGDDRYDYTLSRSVDDLERLLDQLEHERQHHPRAARLGRHDRHGLRQHAIPSESSAWCVAQHRGLPSAAGKDLPAGL